MFDQFSYGYLGFTLGPDGAVIVDPGLLDAGTTDNCGEVTYVCTIGGDEVEEEEEEEEGYSTDS